MSKLIFLFLDGTGIGRADETNPFFEASTEYLPFYGTDPVLPDGTPLKAIDACLGVEGMPMSATGQTTLYTGLNVPLRLNGHRDSYPDAAMRQMIKEHNIFSRLQRKRLSVRFLNAYPGSSHLFTADHAVIDSTGQLRLSNFFKSQNRINLSVTTCMILSCYMKPFDTEDIRKEMALFHDYSNLSLIEQGISLPIFSPEKAGEIIYQASRRYDMVLYEFFQTDLYGHGFGMPECMGLARRLNRMVKQLLSLLDPNTDTLVLTSDHGNMEDYSTPLHTLNPVPLICWGFKSQGLRDSIFNLADVTPAIVDYFKE